MDILVTGGCGFIGSHLVDRLVAEGHHVTVLDNLSTGTRDYLPASVTLVVGDVADSACVRPLVAAADAVFHLAAVASVDACTHQWFTSHQTNLTGTIAVLDAAAHGGKPPVIYASSAAIYGDNANLPLREDALPAPLSSYGLDKLSAERYADIAWVFHGVPTIGLRFFNVYGPRQDPRSPYSGVISKFVAQARADNPVTYFGDGEQTRDFIYVGDIVELMMRALANANAAQVVNGCTGKATSLKQLAQAIGQVVEKPLIIEHAPARQGDIRHSLGDPARANAILGFTATTPLTEGLASLVAHA